MNDGMVQTECIRRCLIEGVMKAFGKLPTSWIIAEDDDVDLNRRLLAADVFLQNQTALNTFLNLDSECSAECPKKRCHISCCYTDLLDTNEDENATEITVRVLLPQFPSIFVTYVAIYELNDYVLLLMSCIGTWLGVSMLDFNPARLCGDSKICDCDDRLRSVNAKCRYLKNKVEVYERECGSLLINNRLVNFVQQLNIIRRKLDIFERAQCRT